MRNILLKEMKLSASPLTYLFILFGLMFFIPGYPILCGAFFVTLGIFYSFQAAREANDIVYSALLPIAKKQVVHGKYAFVCVIEGAALLVMTVPVWIRMTVLADAPVYREDALMNANLYALGCVLVIFGLFNWLFVAGFFKTAYRLGRPFVVYLAAALCTIILAEAMHYFPGLETLNAFGCEHMDVQWSVLCLGFLVYGALTLLSCRMACRRFERLDL